MKHPAFIALGATALTLLAPLAHAKGMSAQEFVTKASIANKFEIESSRLALAKSDDDDVEDFAEMMIDDHTKTGAELKSTLAAAGLNIKPRNSLDKKHQGMMNQLKSLSGQQFEHRYIAMQRNAHKEAVDLFSGYAANGGNAALREFAANTLPTLRDHHEEVNEIDE